MVNGQQNQLLQLLLWHHLCQSQGWAGGHTYPGQNLPYNSSNNDSVGSWGHKLRLAKVWWSKVPIGATTVECIQRHSHYNYPSKKRFQEIYTHKFYNHHQQKLKKLITDVCSFDSPVSPPPPPLNKLCNGTDLAGDQEEIDMAREVHAEKQWHQASHHQQAAFPRQHQHRLRRFLVHILPTAPFSVLLRQASQHLQIIAPHVNQVFEMLKERWEKDLL